MSRDKKLLWKTRAGSKNIRFSEMHQLLKAFDFQLLRIRGSHHIYAHPHINELINIQNAGGKVKTYQVRQFLQIIDRYHLQLKEEKGKEP